MLKTPDTLQAFCSHGCLHIQRLRYVYYHGLSLLFASRVNSQFWNIFQRCIMNRFDIHKWLFPSINLREKIQSVKWPRRSLGSLRAEFSSPRKQYALKPVVINMDASRKFLIRRLNRLPFKNYRFRICSRISRSI